MRAWRSASNCWGVLLVFPSFDTDLGATLLGAIMTGFAGAADGPLPMVAGRPAKEGAYGAAGCVAGCTNPTPESSPDALTKLSRPANLVHEAFCS